ncbi:MAG: hypothetical protein LM593_03810 [Candidatus Verstraetearchaeota archaeon]|jgi:hypothetical protein|nr:hypothetical protein [Candidatus Verstraetearchaeota archaeon]
MKRTVLKDSIIEYEEYRNIGIITLHLIRNPELNNNEVKRKILNLFKNEVMSKSWIWKDVFSKSYINKEINDYINGIKNDGPFIVYKNCCIFFGENSISLSAEKYLIKKFAKDLINFIDNKTL